MSRKQTFIVTLEFADKIVDDNEILGIATNIATAIKNEANGYGITTDVSDTYTTSVSVKPQFLDEVVTINVLD